jgi:hypothetical protein
VQTPLAQSLATPHAPLVPQRGQLVAPPQSTSLSPPFFTVSTQVGALQAPEVQTPLVQSVATLQVLFAAQRGQVVAPPQSTSLSPPFLAASVHEGV